MDQVVKYDVTDAAIAEMKSQYMGFAIQGIDDKEGFDMVHEARMVVKGKRVEVEKKRKELKADALAWGKAVDTEAKRITALLIPIEDHLKSEENKVTEEKTRIKEEKERKERERVQGRVDALLKFEVSLPFFDVAAMTNEEFEESLSHAEKSYGAKQERIAREEAERKEREEKERREREAEESKLKAEREELEKLRMEQESKEAEIRAEQERIETEKRKIEEEKRLEEAKKVAAEKALKDAEEQRVHEAAEAMRLEELKPDKEKLLKYVEDFPECPEVKSDEAKQIVNIFAKKINIALGEMQNNIEKWL